MTIGKEEAVARAIAFARLHGITTRVVEVIFAKGSDLEGNRRENEDRWAVQFEIEVPPNIVRDPDTHMICINAHTGEATLTPVM